MSPHVQKAIPNLSSEDALRVHVELDGRRCALQAMEQEILGRERVLRQMEMDLLMKSRI